MTHSMVGGSITTSLNASRSRQLSLHHCDKPLLIQTDMCGQIVFGPARAAEPWRSSRVSFSELLLDSKTCNLKMCSFRPRPQVEKLCCTDFGSKYLIILPWSLCSRLRVRFLVTLTCNNYTKQCLTRILTSECAGVEAVLI